ncbi:MAG: hypothetical protein Kow00121_42960 [Elainellaceae cyanobacterium]
MQYFKELSGDTPGSFLFGMGHNRAERDNVDIPMDAASVTSKDMVDSPVWQQAEAYFADGNYAQATELYTQMLADHPAEILLYGRLGLALLLQGEEVDAQSAWMATILEAESEEEQIQQIIQLINILRVEADRQVEQANYESAWLIRQHLREFVPEDTENLLVVLQLALQAQIFSFEDPLLEQVTEALASSSEDEDSDDNNTTKQLIGEHLLKAAALLLEYHSNHPATLEFLQHCISYWSIPSLVSPAVSFLLQRAGAYHERSQHIVAAHLGLMCLALAPNDVNLMLKVLHIIQHGDVKCLRESIKIAERGVALSTRLVDQIIATNALLASWIYSGGSWQRATEIYQDYKALLAQLVRSQDELANGTLDLGFLSALLPLGGLAFYFEDEPEEVRPLRNQIAAVAQRHLQFVLNNEFKQYQSSNSARKTSSLISRTPRIGYLAGSFRKHSVGWLCRWLMQYHDRDRFDVHLYSSRHSTDFIQQTFREQYGDRFHAVPSAIADIADQIYADEIDILIELDSLTSLGGCGVVALKPAPIQVHWLGYDSSGIPGVDYFIADPYVLPDDAQGYYSETIWRLPQTYIAVDGFETHLPSLRRDQLGIPNDAVVYLSSQTGMKRNVDNARLQLKILKEVPNSYFLVKSFRAIPEFIETFFTELAAEEGINPDRLRFLPDVPSEFTHRANLALADIVLDTYPYNGATTSLEALWMGLPIVTRVGQQFAARNSYTMMMNVGVTEGIAWTDDEYLEWGIRLGQDAALREDIFYRLRQSRHTSPLWNGQQFAREMEKAYTQMWERYLES